MIFSKPEKNYYIPEICKNSKTTPLRLHQKHNRWIQLPQLFLCVAERHAIFLLFHMFLWCSFTNNAWSHAINKRNQNKSGAKALIPIYRLIVEGLKVQDAIISDIIIYPEMGISRTDREETSKLISNFSFSPAWSAYVLVKEDWTYNSLISSLSSPSSLPKFSKIKWQLEQLSFPDINLSSVRH